MNFQIKGLSKNTFSRYFSMDDVALAEHNVIRSTVSESNSIPCRVSLEEAHAGESVILVNHYHQNEETPYRSCHAVYVREGAEEVALSVNEIPKLIYKRLLSIRAFDKNHHIQTAEVTEGVSAKEIIGKLFEDQSVDYLHIHSAREGCFTAKVVRA